jgi:hypothetical protein
MNVTRVESRSVRAIAASLLATTLILIVALGSRAISLESGDSAGPSLELPPSLAEYLFLLVAPAALAGIVAFAFVLIPMLRPRKREDEELVSERPPVPWWIQAVTFTVVLAAITAPVVLAFWGSSGGRHTTTGSGSAPSSPPDASGAPVLPAGRPGAQAWSWTPVGVVTAGAAVLLVGMAAARRRGPSASAPERSAGAAFRRTVLDSIEDLRAEPDPRRAVVAAYARMEQDLSSNGLPRRAWEAPLEYLDRALLDLQVNPASISKLTTLFESAKFGHHPVDDAMKTEAIAALERIADSLSEREP